MKSRLLDTALSLYESFSSEQSSSETLTAYEFKALRHLSKDRNIAIQKAEKSGLDKLRARCRSGALGSAKLLTRAKYRKNWKLCLANKKKSLDIQFYSRIDKTLKK